MVSSMTSVKLTRTMCASQKRDHGTPSAGKSPLAAQIDHEGRDVTRHIMVLLHPQREDSAVAAVSVWKALLDDGIRDLTSPGTSVGHVTPIAAMTAGAAATTTAEVATRATVATTVTAGAGSTVNAATMVSVAASAAIDPTGEHTK